MEIYNEVLLFTYFLLCSIIYIQFSKVVEFDTLSAFSFPLRLLSLSSTLFQVVNDLLNPAGQNLRIREDKQVCDSASDNLCCFSVDNMCTAALTDL